MRHREVKKDDADILPGENIHHLAAVLALNNIGYAAFSAERHAQTAQPWHLVIDKQHREGRIKVFFHESTPFRAIGIETVTVVPSPSADLKVSSPPCSL